MASVSVLNSMIWKLGERGSVQLVQFFAQMLLARILMPNDYGTLAIVLVFINLANIFIQSGLPAALIQKKEIDETDTSTVFFSSLFISIICITIVWYFAPFVASFYKDEAIVDYLRATSLVLIIGAFNSVQVALISRKLQFKKNFISSFVGIVVAAVVATYMAFNGFGVWALIANYAINIVVTSLVLYVINPWLPSLKFSLTKLRSLLGFGSNIMFANLISVLFTDLYALIIGKRYSKIWLGYYENGNRIPAAASNALTTTVQSVLLPVLSGVQTDVVRLKHMMRKSVQISSLTLFPMMALLCVCADPLIRLLLTDKWIMAVPFLQLSAVLYAFYPIHSTNLQAINALGQSQVFMHCEIKKKITELVILGITIWFNIYVMAIGRVVASLIALYINMHPNSRFVHYGLREQIQDFLPAMILSIVSIGMVYPLVFCSLHPIVTIFLQAILGLGLYVAGTIRFNREALRYFFDKLRKR